MFVKLWKCGYENITKQHTCILKTRVVMSMDM